MSRRSLPRTVEWIGDLDGYVSMIDQTRLPGELVMLECRESQTVREAITTLRVRGAPAIGIAAAMGAVLGIRDFAGSDRQAFLGKLDEVCDELGRSRPTAVNLFWALDRMRRCARSHETVRVENLKQILLDEAKLIRTQDAEMCRAIGKHGEPLIKAGAGILTHCNAGSLATAEYGTALAPLYTAQELGRSFRVYADETRPLLQGSRLTAWELQQAGIDVTLLCDGMVGALMKQGRVNLVITGADRIAANGDVANKIGTYGVALLAKAHGIPFFVAAPSSTFDAAIPDGSHITIEERSPQEFSGSLGRPIAPRDVPWYSPAFDVTPAELLHGIITEHGIIQPVNAETIAAVGHAARGFEPQRHRGTET